MEDSIVIIARVHIKDRDMVVNALRADGVNAFSTMASRGTTKWVVYVPDKDEVRARETMERIKDAYNR
jgi:hypothetical protein